MSFQGIGEISKIVVSKNVDKLESVITIDYGDDNLDNFETDQYGARSIKMENIYIDFQVPGFPFQYLLPFSP